MTFLVAQEGNKVRFRTNIMAPLMFAEMIHEHEKPITKKGKTLSDRFIRPSLCDFWVIQARI